MYVAHSKEYGGRMKLFRIASLTVVLTFVCAGVAQATPRLVRSTPPFIGGFYSESGSTKGVAFIQLFVSGSGKEILGGHTSGGSCLASAALVVEGVQNTGGITFNFPRSIPISPSGAFTATETVTMTPEETQSTVGASGTITISGHFIKGTIVSYRTNAVVGTFNAPSICATATPKRVVLQWDINDL
jgi:hypothetical protein